MKRDLVGICCVAALGLAPAALAQDCIDVVWCEDLDGYAVDQRIIGQDCDTDTCTDDPFSGCGAGLRWAVWTGGNDNNAASMIIANPAPDGGGDNVLEVDRDAGPGQEEDLVYEMGTLNINPNGAYQFAIQVYVPSEFMDQDNRDWYFILLNRYPASNNWSTQLHFNSNSQTAISDFDGTEVDFALDTWMTLQVNIILSGDRQIIWLDGNGDGIKQPGEVIDKGENGWTEGVSGGGILDLQALDLYANNSDVAVLVDMGPGAGPGNSGGLCTIPDTGACCEDDGTCSITNQGDCEAGTGYFKGIGTECGGCEVRGGSGWTLDAPFVWDGSGNRGLGAYDDCGDDPFFFGDQDDSFVVTVPWDQRWRFDACDTTLDVLMAMGTGGQCAANRRVSFDSGSCADNIQAFFMDELGAGVVNVTVEGELGATGDYVLSVTAQCPRIGVDGNDEGETCGADTNGGCNMDVPNYVTINCGDTIRGAQFFDGGARDTDWFELTIDEDTEITLTGSSVFSGAVFGVIQDSDTQDCNEVQFVTPLDTTGSCASGDRDAVVVAVLENTDRDGGDPDTTTWWLFAAPAFGGPIAACDEGFVGEAEDPGPDLDPDVFGQNGYTISLACEPAGGSCQGDTDEDGDVDFQDLLAVLARFGCTEDCGNRDVDGDGDVDFQDIVTLLARWGDCP